MKVKKRNFNFTCEITKFAMAAFRTPQCQDGDQVLKCHESDARA